MTNTIRRTILFILSVSAAIFVIFYQPESATACPGAITRYYLNHFLDDSGALNAVTAIYLNYRVFDTLLETLILLVCIIAVISFSWRQDDEK